MGWRVPEKAGTIRGLLMEVPYEGYVGWYCEYMGQQSEPRYECGNAMVSLYENMSFGAPDLRQRNYKLKGSSYNCNVEQADEYDVVTCLLPLPAEGMEDPEAGEYRYSPNDDNLIS
mmetsp:Transcript_9530/g.11741  ORF Transcript_9530/g.11741 Transcript_9530/m.11741 type:complete len:116 (-) Transcript_9530:242-589(-)